eukprot:1152509-Pelagomonas_calceolata.AAC.6
MNYAGRAALSLHPPTLLYPFSNDRTSGDYATGGSAPKNATFKSGEGCMRASQKQRHSVLVYASDISHGLTALLSTIGESGGRSMICGVIHNCNSL